MALETQDPPETEDEEVARAVAQHERERTAEFDPESGAVNGNGAGDESLGGAPETTTEDDGQVAFVVEHGVRLSINDLAGRNTPIVYEFKLDSKGIPGASGMGLLSFRDPDRTLVVPGRAGKVVTEPTYDGEGNVKKVTVRQHFKPSMAYDASSEAGRVALGLPPEPVE